tara:strand:- start:1934 stop:2314 length:381 start_codon:yes stop_codon:yes gene_type:complete
MIEALRFCTLNESEGIYLDGDVIVVALPDHPWGVEDKRVHAVCEVEDPEIEAKLLQKQANGIVHPVLSYPYADYEIIPNNAEPVVKAVSTKHVDISSLHEDRQITVRDRTTPVNKLTQSECSLKDR